MFMKKNMVLFTRSNIFQFISLDFFSPPPHSMFCMSSIEKFAIESQKKGTKMRIEKRRNKCKLQKAIHHHQMHHTVI